ncbi:MAG: methyltransferase [Clostridia bacterium]|nr:methyltransferase [Clostridia bacterium]
MTDEKSLSTPASSAESFDFLQSIILASNRGVLRKLTLSVPNQNGLAPRQVAHLATLRGKTVLTFEAQYEKGKVSHTHLSLENAAEKVAELLALYNRAFLSTSLGDAELLRSKKGKITKKGTARLLQAMESEQRAETFVLPLDRQVNHIFDGTAPFLTYLGISDENGRVYDKRQAKFRQINRFLEHFAVVYPKLPKEGRLTVYDLCCGKSYLSFALYAYLHDICGREVDMLCMDLKEDVIAYCAETGKALGYTGMRFEVGDIRQLPETNHPHLVVSLHACDIATDIVLDTAIRLGAEVILSTPCCHRYINRKFDSPALSFIYDSPHLCARLGETVTDALRLMRLQLSGYKAEAVELIDISDTPKNTLLRAVKLPHFDPNSPKAKEAKQAYERTLKYLLGDGADTYLKDIL